MLHLLQFQGLKINNYPCRDIEALADALADDICLCWDCLL